jgi:hypothetical protein
MAFFRMKLHSNYVVIEDSRMEYFTVTGFRQNILLVVTGHVVGMDKIKRSVIRDIFKYFRLHNQIHTVPSDMGYPDSVRSIVQLEFDGLCRDQSQPINITFLAVVCEQLHPQTYSKNRCFPQQRFFFEDINESKILQVLHSQLEMAHSGKNDFVGI